MSLYKKYPAHQVFLRRALVIVAGVVALPVMLFWKDRARFYSYLHRVWTAGLPAVFLCVEPGEKHDTKLLHLFYASVRSGYGRENPGWY